MKNLNVKSVTAKDIKENWGFSTSYLPPTHRGVELFVRCNAKGVVNWSKTLLYNREDLEKYNYTIIEVINVDEIIASEGPIPIIPMPKTSMTAIAYIKTQCNEFRGIETILVPHDCLIIGQIYKREDNQDWYWCACKRDNIMDVSVEVAEIAKTVLEMSVKRKINYSTALELYFDVKEETEAIERRDLSDFEKLLLIKLKSIDENLVYHFDKVNDLIKSNITYQDLELSLTKIIGCEKSEKIVDWLKGEEVSHNLSKRLKT